MSAGDVHTLSKRGQWINRVVGEGEMSRSFSSKQEAVDEGRRLAETLGTEHRVVDAEPTGVVTDEDGASA